ncbi:MAG: chemotaxis response regulator protein-glutamate methylesterase [Spirochaetales bacterium]|nr:chemotaxis response regulator protein-glutamate methylesterase [Spirochaetales bacterium]
MKKIKVLVVDDSAVVREVLGKTISGDPELHYLGSASDPIFAMQKMEKEWPDVLVLDIEMPRMDGITFLRKLSRESPLPVVICSSVAEKDAAVTLEALSLGAAEIITKPRLGVKDFLTESETLMRDAIKAAFLAGSGKSRESPAARTSPPEQRPPLKAQESGTSGLVAIGASTGGIHALETILSALPEVCPPILIVQHMPERFTRAFANRLNSVASLRTKEAEDGTRLEPGLALIAPGNFHMQLGPGQQKVQIFQGELVNRHRPSVDVLFKSVAKYAPGSLGILLTGMGDDGAAGLLSMRKAGCRTIAQDRATSVVYGMPAEAARLGAAERILPLEEMARAIQEYGAQKRK